MYHNPLKLSRILYVFFILTAGMLLSCASNVEEAIINEPNPLKQMLIIREYSFIRQYDTAEKLYLQMKEIHDDPALLIEIEYELAFLQVQKKKYKKAETIFKDIIQTYENSIDNSYLPQWPYYLSIKVLNDVVLPELNPEQAPSSENT